MVQVDHSDTPQPEPEPAVPVLAFDLLHLEQKQRTRFIRDGGPERLSTHCEDVDDIFGGGMERGIVMGISSEGVEGRLISLNLLSSVLLSHLPLGSQQIQTPTTKVTIIDTTGSFPLHLLAQVLKSRITTSHALSTRPAIQTSNQTISYSTRTKAEDEFDIDKEVQQCLQMIAISRVFDIEGLWEVLGEIGHDTPTDMPSSPPPPPPVSDGAIQSSPDWPESTEINDSQDDAEEDSPNVEDDYNLNKLLSETKEREKDTGIEIIIIDTMTQIINELFSRQEKGDAHTILSLLSRQLHALSTTQNILTILHNTTTPSDPSYSHPYRNQAQARQKPKSNPQPTSLFPSNPLKPSLGSIFSQFPSLHIFISHLPKSREDAEVLYTTHPEEDPLGETLRGVRYVGVVEVLVDECACFPVAGEKGSRKLGYREQRWCAVEIDAAGTGLKSAFEVRGGMKGMGMEGRGFERGTVDAEKEGETGKGSTETEVGNIAKIWGFGGRRV